MTPTTPIGGTTQNARLRMGHYELFERFAAGAMAELYLGRARGEEGFEKAVVIKRVLPRLQNDPRFVQMLQKEARIHASLSHKNIVQIHDLGVSAEGEYFIVLEYVDGRDLAALLNIYAKSAESAPRKRVHDAVALFILSQLAEGIHFAHELRGPDDIPLGLVHRDISPSNILLSYAGEVKLSDFGVAKRYLDESLVHSLKGELAYMSPEQARGAAIDRRSDIFSLGAVAFELFTGEPLRDFSGETDNFLMAASGIVASPQRYRPDIPPAIQNLLTLSLAPDPRDRFPDARAFLDVCLQALTTIPRPPQGEAAELKNSLHALLPPGSKGPRKEPSKVISLLPSMWEDVTVPESSLLRQVTDDMPTPPLAPTIPLSTTLPTLSPVPPSKSPSITAVPEPTLPLRGSALLPSLQNQARRKAHLIALSILILSVGGAAAFHAIVMPLSVAVAYFKSASLTIDTEPPGAKISIDNKPLEKTTPAIITIKRDRRQHTILVSKDGFLPTSYRVRYDQVLKPRVYIPLTVAPLIAPPPIPPHPSVSP